ncbi:hypothetical protein F5Y15DRAFT_188940 [Xylariaceae sp. FL0016]|nr:hypothetical protein F5Y15DRAFT_188940 [Xylariaceae sp. FL0016]
MSRNPRIDLRLRSGCRKCRDRRVKCPEQRPICGHCSRLGFVCRYEMRLSWQQVATVDIKRNESRNKMKLDPIMFINFNRGDFPGVATTAQPSLQNGKPYNLSTKRHLVHSTMPTDSLTSDYHERPKENGKLGISTSPYYLMP